MPLPLHIRYSRAIRYSFNAPVAELIRYIPLIRYSKQVADLRCSGCSGCSGSDRDPTACPEGINMQSPSSAPGPIEVLTVPEAMAALRIKRGKFYDLIRSNQLESFTIGRARRVTAESIRAFIRRQIEEND